MSSYSLNFFGHDCAGERDDASFVSFGPQALSSPFEGGRGDDNTLGLKALLLVFTLFLLSLTTTAQTNIDCRVTAPFLKRVGYDSQKSAFSTSEKRKKGLCYIELGQKPGAPARTHQEPSWQAAGNLGPMAITESGDVWVAPVPAINLYDNKPSEQNRLWKVDAKTGKMTSPIDLPRPDTAFNGQNAFGLLGLGYDCNTKILYATSVAGSSREKQKGRLFAIRLDSLKIIDQIDSLDAFGVGAGWVDGKKQLWFGSARTGEVFSIDLDEKGRFKTKPQLLFSLEGMGPRGDDRIRKIRFGADGRVTLHGVEFYYNLIAPTEKQETVYTLQRTPSGKWAVANIE